MKARSERTKHELLLLYAAQLRHTKNALAEVSEHDDWIPNRERSELRDKIRGCEASMTLLGGTPHPWTEEMEKLLDTRDRLDSRISELQWKLASAKAERKGLAARIVRHESERPGEAPHPGDPGARTGDWP